MSHFYALYCQYCPLSSFQVNIHASICILWQPVTNPPQFSITIQSSPSDTDYEDMYEPTCHTGSVRSQYTMSTMFLSPTHLGTWFSKKGNRGNSLVVQWLGLRTSTAGDMGSIPSWGTKIPHASQRGQKKRK